jgi:hypothetical protein
MYTVKYGMALPLTTQDTVWTETPASRATFLMVGTRQLLDTMYVPDFLSGMGTWWSSNHAPIGC